MIEKLQPNLNRVSTITNIGIIKQTLKIYMLLSNKDQYEYNHFGQWIVRPNPTNNIQKIKTLDRIKQTINAFTLYQIHKNVTQIAGRLDLINQVFARIGLLITEEQFRYYYEFVWEDVLEEERLTEGQGQAYEGNGGCKQKVKYLQIYNLLPLVYQLQQISTIKSKFITWLQTNNPTSTSYNPNYMSTSMYPSPSSSASTSRKMSSQEFNVIKLRIKYINSSQLIEAMRSSKFNLQLMEGFSKKYDQYRKGLLRYIDEQNGKKKFYNSIQAKSTKNISTLYFRQSVQSRQSQQYSTNTVNPTNQQKPIKKPQSPSATPTQTSQARLQNQQKLQQQIFNKKMLNGYFIRQQVSHDVKEGNVDMLDGVVMGGKGPANTKFVTIAHYPNCNTKSSCFCTNSEHSEKVDADCKSTYGNINSIFKKQSSYSYGSVYDSKQSQGNILRKQEVNKQTQYKYHKKLKQNNYKKDSIIKKEVQRVISSIKPFQAKHKPAKSPLQKRITNLQNPPNSLNTKKSIIFAPSCKSSSTFTASSKFNSNFNQDTLPNNQKAIDKTSTQFYMKRINNIKSQPFYNLGSKIIITD